MGYKIGKKHTKLLDYERNNEHFSALGSQQPKIWAEQQQSQLVSAASSGSASAPAGHDYDATPRNVVAFAR